MFTLFELALSAFAVLCIALLSLYMYHLYTRSLKIKRKKIRKKQQARAGRDIGNQAGGNIHTVHNNYHGPSRELTAYEQHLQETINILLKKLQTGDKIKNRLMDQVERKDFELAGVWNEYLTLKDQMNPSALPLLDVKLA